MEHFKQEDILEGNPELDLLILDHISRISSDNTKSQEQFLDYQAAITNDIKRILSVQGAIPLDEQLTTSTQAPLFTEKQIVAFTIGDHRECFGDLFAGFDERRIPRLPNGPLRFIDRVLELNAVEGEVQIGSSLTSEADIPDQGWYLTDPEGSLPYVSLMEAALQPCGFLSAFMGSIKDRTSSDLYFRNLDGELTLSFWPDLPGSTITNRVELISSSTLQDVIIQEYSFELFHNGTPFARGKSSFGYFTPTMLKNQTGLNGKIAQVPWKSSHPESGLWLDYDIDQIGPTDFQEPNLPSIPQVWISKDGGASGNGYIMSRLEIPENAWFYQAHFYQDPVMPGSLGVEAMVQTLASSSSKLVKSASTGWRIKPGTMTSWKYRGQITPGVDSIDIELHIKEQKDEGGRNWIIADGDLWLGKTRIYEVKDISLESYDE